MWALKLLYFIVKYYYCLTLTVIVMFSCPKRSGSVGADKVQRMREILWCVGDAQGLFWLWLCVCFVTPVLSMQHVMVLSTVIDVEVCFSPKISLLFVLFNMWNLLPDFHGLCLQEDITGSGLIIFLREWMTNISWFLLILLSHTNFNRMMRMFQMQ